MIKIILAELLNKKLMQKNRKVIKFNFKDLSLKVYPEVYDPAEDTYLIIDAIDPLEDSLILEIGTGCGLIGLYFAKNKNKVVTTDINPYAVENTLENYSINEDKIEGSFEVRKGDLFNPIKENEKFDIIIFNPPYLPKGYFELDKKDKWLDKAVTGGTDGLELTTRFLKNVKKYLKKDGRAYFVFSTLSSKEKLNTIIKSNKLKKEKIKSVLFDTERIEVISVY